MGAICYWGHWDPLLGFLTSSIKEFEDDSEGRVKTILLAFKRNPQAREAVSFGIRPEEEGKSRGFHMEVQQEATWQRGVSLRASVKRTQV